MTSIQLAPEEIAEGWIANTGTLPGTLPESVDILWDDGIRSSDVGAPSLLDWIFSDDPEDFGCNIRAWRPADGQWIAHDAPNNADGVIPYNLHPDTPVEIQRREGGFWKALAKECIWVSIWYSPDSEIVKFRTVRRSDIPNDDIWDEPFEDDEPATAETFLTRAAELMAERGQTYDTSGQERSMGRIVQAFNAITNRDLKESDGWLFMQILKDVRQWSKPDYHADSAEDCIAYAALKAEALVNARI